MLSFHVELYSFWQNLSFDFEQIEAKKIYSTMILHLQFSLKKKR